MSYCECDYDYDPPEFFDRHTVKRARKTFKCDECHGPIKPGESYERKVGKWDGDFDVYRECALCLEMRQWAKISVPCFCCNIFGELHERIRYMVDDVKDTVPGFVVEWGRRAVKIRQRGGRP